MWSKTVLTGKISSRDYQTNQKTNYVYNIYLVSLQ